MSSFKKDFKNRPQHDTDKSRDAFIKQANTRFDKALDKKKSYQKEGFGGLKKRTAGMSDSEIKDRADDERASHKRDRRNFVN